MDTLTRTVNGGQVIAYDRFGRTDRPIAVLVHGMGDHRRRMTALGETLAGQYDVVAVDLPGHGESSTDGVVYEIPAFAEALHELASVLAQGPVHYIGHSLGAVVLLVLAARHPDSVRSLVMLDPGTMMETATREQLAAFYSSLTPDNFAESLRAMLFPLLSGPDEDPAVLEELMAQQLRTGLPGFLSMGWSVVDVDQNCPVADVTAPALLVTGGAPLASLDRVRELAPRWTVRQLPGLGHMQLVNPASTGDLVNEFVNRQP